MILVSRLARALRFGCLKRYVARELYALLPNPPDHSSSSRSCATILFDYIETFSNRSRHQRALEDRTPAEV
jgi:hypothetical protein